MYILHGSWLINSYTDPEDSFVLWAETDVPSALPAAGAERVRAHPFAASGRTLRRLLRKELSLPDEIVRDLRECLAVVRLPSTRSAPQASPGPLRQEQSGGQSKLKLSPWQVETLGVPVRTVLRFLAALPAEDGGLPGIKVGSDLRFWTWAGKLALELLAGQRYKPVLLRQDDHYLALWQPLWDEPRDVARLDKLVQAMPPLCRAVFRVKDKSSPSTPRALLDNFFAIVVNAFPRWYGTLGRAWNHLRLTTAELWVRALMGKSPVVEESAANLTMFAEQYRLWSEPLPGLGDESFRLFFRLDPPSVVGEQTGVVAPTSRTQDWALQYMLQASDDPSLLVPAETVWRERGSTLRFLQRQFHAPQERLLIGLGQASRVFPPIESSLRSPRPERCQLTVEEAHTFIQESSLLLQSYGFGVLVPNLGKELSLRVRLQPKQARPTPKGGVGGLTFESIVEYDWQLALGEEALPPEEFEKLAALKVPLVQVRGQWVELRPGQIEKTLKFLKRHRAGGELSLPEALQLALSQDLASLTGGLPVREVVADGWIGELLDQLAHGGRLAPLPVPADFHGTLRPYQAVGLAWLAFLRQWGLGACLADDMGLGKTIQVIALLLHERVAGNGPTRPALIICPTSVVGNWQRELARFAPDLRVLAYHGAARKKVALSEQTAQHDVVLSSYALLRRDEKELVAQEWGDVILDEAQNIKNPATRQAQVARKLPAQWRAALTGTPVENRLSELWSIFHFTNSGYLGSEENFRRQLANPIERAGDPVATQRLKELVNPFILRRVKTDPAVISDLPQKNEIKAYCNLTREQATLYQAVVRDHMERIAVAEGIDRRGHILAMLMKLKQVCNHPAQFLADGSRLAGRSGKLSRLSEMLDEVRAVGDRALIFTQFATMGRMLQEYLQETFFDEVLFLHGGTPAKSRDRMVDRFQNDPHGPLFFILSIKAGGTGLNLMRANHVFHFDRWWNPAVEDQATDRAFRIGQTRNVQVYKYLCVGTFEEKVDDLL
ncbi:MAG: DEAD/DEAH box helicase, partial [Chloroflexi bacterium]|nr:DEAD/DEAH box helicase [Chloroflexota bacterium]